MEKLEFGLLFTQRLLQVHAESTSFIYPNLDSYSADHLFAPLIRKRNYLLTVIESMSDRDIVHVTDPLGIRTSLVRIGDDLCLIGPYVTEVPKLADMKKRFQEADIKEDHLDAFQEYVAHVPQQSIDNIAYATHTLMQGIVGENSQAIVYYVNLHESKSVRLLAEAAGAPVTTMPQQLYTNVITSEDNVSLLYQLETSLADQMANSQTAKALKTLSHIEAIYRYGAKSEADLDTMKINSAVLCTQMRLNAIWAGVLPALAEIRARYFLSLIKLAVSTDEITQLRRYMLAQFCDLIRKEKLDSLSPKIRQIVQFIMADLSGDLNIENLAAQVNISPNYLSSCFKKEMNQSLSVYIRDKRLESAAQFLAYTNMPIHDVAVCVGFSDFSYFAKTFREKYGMTPTKYRSQK